MSKVILDACCGGRMFWFDKNHEHTLFMDKRKADKGHIKQQFNHSINPDIIADFTNMPFKDKSFKLVVFDPPHVKSLNENSITYKKYGSLIAQSWQSDLKNGFKECWRVLEDYGVLIFKWNEVQIPLKDVLKLFPEKPLFGHTTAKSGKTKWITFMKIPNEVVTSNPQAKQDGDL